MSAGASASGVWPGAPRLGALARDTVAAARAQLATTVTLVIVLATVCFAILVTTGQSAASEARIVGQIDSAGTRLVALSDDGGSAGILPSAPEALARLSDVSWAFGLSAAVDAVNPALPSARVGSRVMIGALPPDVALVRGRLPRQGEAVVGVDAASALNLGPGLGRVAPDRSPGRSTEDGRSASLADATGVVGVFRATGPLAHLNDSILVAGTADEVTALRYVYVLARDVTVVDRLEEVLSTSTPTVSAAALTVETPQGAIALRDVIAGRLGAASRQLMAVVMGVGAVIVAVTMVSATVARRRDFGRRRALGATRSALVATLLAQAAIAAIIGILVGTTAGVLTLAATTGSLPAASFVGGVAGLALLLTLATSAPIATIAAHRDPLRILRVP